MLQTAMFLHIKDLEMSLEIIRPTGDHMAISAMQSAIENAKTFLPKERELLESFALHYMGCDCENCKIDIQKRFDVIFKNNSNG